MRSVLLLCALAVGVAMCAGSNVDIVVRGIVSVADDDALQYLDIALVDKRGSVLRSAGLEATRYFSLKLNQAVEGALTLKVLTRLPPSRAVVDQAASVLEAPITSIVGTVDVMTLKVGVVRVAPTAAADSTGSLSTALVAVGIIVVVALARDHIMMLFDSMSFGQTQKRQVVMMAR